MSASKQQQKQYAPSENVIRRIGRWRVVRTIGGYNLQYLGTVRGRPAWKNDSFKISRDVALEELNTKRVR